MDLRRALVTAALVAVPAALAQDDAQGHMGRGVQLMQQHLYAEAASELEQALAADPTLAPARYQYAVCLFAQGRNGEAQQQFERVVREGGKGPELQYYLGRLDLLNNNPASAIRRLSGITGKVPQAAYYLALACAAARDNAAALKWLEQAAHNDPADYRVHYHLARLYTASGRKADADREYRLYAEGKNSHAHTEADARACAAALDGGHSETAVATCRRMFDPNDPEKLILMAQLLGEHGRYEDAIAPLQRATSLDQTSFDAWHDLGLTYFRLQRYADARAPLEKAVALRPDYFESVNLLAGDLYLLGDYAAAIPMLERAHRLKPSDAQLADVLDKLRRNQQQK